jgi:hypothetical protein
MIIHSGKTDSGNDLKMCTKVLVRDFHQMEQKYWKHFSSPVMQKIISGVQTYIFIEAHILLELI